MSSTPLTSTLPHSSTQVSANGNIYISPSAISYPANWPYTVPNNSVLTTSHSYLGPSTISCDVLTLKDGNGKSIVTIDQTGAVIWHGDILINEAVQALNNVFVLSAENAAKITLAVKQRIRNTVFEEIISLADSKGSLTADDLTYLYQAAKIIDKLKGGND